MAKKRYSNYVGNPTIDYNKYVQQYRNMYYNLFRANFKWTGLNYRQEDYIMRRFWSEGTVAAFKIPLADEIAFAPWAMQQIDMYGLPEEVVLVNQYGSPLVPSGTQVVDKDVCLGYMQRSKKAISETVFWYCDRIAQVDMVINTNLQLHKLPFVIPVDEDHEKIEDAVSKILNNELVLFVEGVDPNLFKAVATGAPYIIDKLQEYKTGLTNELKTYLGVNNAGAVEKREQLQLSEINANNQEINDFELNFVDSLTEWTDKIKETLGITISVEATSEPVETEGVVKDGDKPGPKEGSEDAD